MIGFALESPSGVGPTGIGYFAVGGVQVVAIPEPSIYASIALAGFPLAAAMRRRSHALRQTGGNPRI